jgi:glycerol-3-phosphate O-acyltransferase
VPGSRTVDPTTYVLDGGRVVVDPDRDAAYTRELGERLAEQYRRHTVIMTTQLVAHGIHRAFVRSTPSLEAFARLRQRGEFEIEERQLAEETGAMRDRLVTLEQAGLLHLSDRVRQGRPESLIDDALRAWTGYHQRTAAERRGDRVMLLDPRLVLFYQNRLAPFAESLADEPSRVAARSIAAFGASR